MTRRKGRVKEGRERSRSEIDLWRNSWVRPNPKAMVAEGGNARSSMQGNHSVSVHLADMHDSSQIAHHPRTRLRPFESHRFSFPPPNRLLCHCQPCRCKKSKHTFLYSSIRLSMPAMRSAISFIL